MSCMCFNKLGHADCVANGCLLSRNATTFGGNGEAQSPAHNKVKEFRSIVVVGKSRGARLRQARKHVQDLRDKFASVKGWPGDEAILDQDFWRSTRDTLEKLVQCFHEANAFNTVMSDHVLVDDVEYSLTEAGATSLAERNDK